MRVDGNTRLSAATWWPTVTLTAATTGVPENEGQCCLLMNHDDKAKYSELHREHFSTPTGLLDREEQVELNGTRSLPSYSVIKL